MSLRNAICLSANVQMPNNTLASTKIYMLELSPASTKCTQVLPLSYFAGVVVLVDVRYCSIHRRIVDLGLGESKMSYKLTPISF
jgi:hypothetical protein